MDWPKSSLNDELKFKLETLSLITNHQSTKNFWKFRRLEGDSQKSQKKVD